MKLGVEVAPGAAANLFYFHFSNLSLWGRNNNENRRSSTGGRERDCCEKRSGRVVQGTGCRSRHRCEPVLIFSSFSNLSLNHEEWERNDPKTEVVVPVDGTDPVAVGAAARPEVDVAPGATAKSFEIHFLTFLLSFTKNGGKTIRKPLRSSRLPESPQSRQAQRRNPESMIYQAPPRTRFSFIFSPMPGIRPGAELDLSMNFEKVNISDTVGLTGIYGRGQVGLLRPG